MLQWQNLLKGGNFLRACIEESATKVSYKCATDREQVDSWRRMNIEMNKESSFSEMREFSKGNVCEYEAEKKTLEDESTETLLVFIQRAILMTFWG